MFSLKWGHFQKFAQTLLFPSLSHDHTLFIFIFYFVLLTKHTHTHGSTLPPLNHENLHHFLTCLLLFSLLSSTLESWEPWHERALISCWKHCTKWPFKSKNRKSYILFIFLSSLLLFTWICGCLGRVFELKTLSMEGCTRQWLGVIFRSLNFFLFYMCYRFGLGFTSNQVLHRF